MKAFYLIILFLQSEPCISQNHIDSLFIRIETGLYENKEYLDALFFDEYEPEWNQLIDIEPNMDDLFRVGLANQIISEHYSDSKLYTTPSKFEKRIDNGILTFHGYYHLRNGETIFVRGNMYVESREFLGLEHAKFETKGITPFQVSYISLNNTEVEIFNSPKLCVAYSTDAKKWNKQHFKYSSTLFNTIYIGCEVNLSQLSFSKKIELPNIQHAQTLYLSSFNLIGSNNKKNSNIAWIAVNDSKVVGVWLLDNFLNFSYNENITIELRDMIIKNQKFSNLIKYSTNQI